MVWRVTFDVSIRGLGSEKMIFEQDEIVVGRTPNMADMVFSRDNVSRRHCKFQVRDDGTVWIIDLQSSNGTWVNGMQVHEQVFGLEDELFSGDRLVRLAKPAEWVEPEPPAVYELVAHPHSKGTAIERVRVMASQLGGDLVLRYVLEGAIERLEVPGGRLDPERLWEHTCTELFVGGAGTSYVEWNFSPTLQSARFALLRLPGAGRARTWGSARQGREGREHAVADGPWGVCRPDAGADRVLRDHPRRGRDAVLLGARTPVGTAGLPSSRRLGRRAGRGVAMTWRVTLDVRERGLDEGETQVFDQDEIVLGRDARRAPEWVEGTG